MSQLVEVKVPDIGDFDTVEVIEVLVKPGDTIRAEQSLIEGIQNDQTDPLLPNLRVIAGDSQRCQPGRELKARRQQEFQRKTIAHRSRPALNEVNRNWILP